MDAQRAAEAQLDLIETQLCHLLELLEQERGRGAPMGWGDVGQLSHIRSKLDGVERFWTNEED